MPPRRADAGPVQIVVSLGKQKLSVYEAGQLVGTTRVSTGQRGFETPTGIFSIIQKRRRHYSNIYRGAPMPFMQRLTWSGIALHQGVVPGYRASHGCIRLPGRFARDLFRYTERRSHVVVLNGDPKPRLIAHPTLFQPTPVTAASTARLSHLPRSGVRQAMNTSDSTANRSDAPPSDVVVPPLATSRLPASARAPAIANVYHQFDVQELAADRLRARASRSDAPLRILITRRSTQDHVRQAQRMLTDLGYDPGPADGVIGKQTVIAVKAFQQAHELPATGYPDPRFYRELNLAAGREPPSHAVIRIRQRARDIFAAPVGLAEPERPLGTHLYTVVQLDPATGHAAWNGMTIKARGRLPGGSNRPTAARTAGKAAATQPVTMGRVLDRVTMPAHVRMHIEDLLTPGSSLIITDGGHTRETGLDTDFIVLTR